jgi:hypothetical protein
MLGHRFRFYRPFSPLIGPNPILPLTSQPKAGELIAVIEFYFRFNHGFLNPHAGIRTVGSQPSLIYMRVSE